MFDKTRHVYIGTVDAHFCPGAAFSCRQYPQGRQADAIPIGPIVVPFLGLPKRILNMNPPKGTTMGLWIGGSCCSHIGGTAAICAVAGEAPPGLPPLRVCMWMD